MPFTSDDLDAIESKIPAAKTKEFSLDELDALSAEYPATGLSLPKRAPAPEMGLDPEPEGPGFFAKAADVLVNDWPEFALNDVPNLAKTYGARGISAMEQSLGGAAQFLGEMDQKLAQTGPEEWRRDPGIQSPYIQKGKDLYAEGKMIHDLVEKENPFKTKGGEISAMAAESMMQMVPTLTISAVNPALGLGIMGTMTGGQKYGENRADGKSVNQSAVNAVWQGAVEGLTERVPMGKLFELFKPGTKRLVRKLAEYYGAELVTEHIATALQNGADAFFTENDAPLNQRIGSTVDYWVSDAHFQDQVDTALVTVLQSTLMGGGSVMINKVGGSAEAKALQAEWEALPDAEKKRIAAEQEQSQTRAMLRKMRGANGNFAPFEGETDLATGRPLTEIQTDPEPAGEQSAPREVAASVIEEAVAAVQPVPVAPVQAQGMTEEVAQETPVEQEQPTVVDEEQEIADLEMDLAAHTAASSPVNDLPDPTNDQIGKNAKLGHHKVQGLDISIENPIGSIRKDKETGGKKWQTKMTAHYGYIRGTKGGIEGGKPSKLDVFLTPGASSAESVFIVDQIDPKTGKFDEHKVVMGPKFEQGARMTYLSNYDKTGESRVGAVTEMPMEDFKAWRKTYDPTKPVDQNVPFTEGAATNETNVGPDAGLSQEAGRGNDDAGVRVSGDAAKGIPEGKPGGGETGGTGVPGLTSDQVAFVQDKVAALGSIAAVDAKYGDKTTIDTFAREHARKIFAPEGKKPAAPFMSEAEIHEKALADKLKAGGIAEDSELHSDLMNERRTLVRQPDPVTGLQKVDYHRPSLDRAWFAHKESGRAFAYADIDLRNLGGLNKHMGANAKADAHVRAIAEIINDDMKENFPGVQVFRKGGDEFGVIAPDSTESELRGILEKTGAKINAYAKKQGLSEIYNPKGGSPGIGIYSGVTEFSAHDSVDRVIEAADGRTALAKLAKEGISNVDGKTVEAARPGQDTSGETESGTGEESEVGQEEGSAPEVVKPIEKYKAKVAAQKAKAGGELRTLRDDYGVKNIDGWHNDGETKREYLNDAKTFLNALKKHLSWDGKVNINQSGVSGPGDASISLLRPDGSGIYLTITEASGMPGMKPNASGMVFMYRKATTKDPYGTKGANRWADGTLTVGELSEQILKESPEAAPANTKPVMEKGVFFGRVADRLAKDGKLKAVAPGSDNQNFAIAYKDAYRKATVDELKYSVSQGVDVAAAHAAAVNVSDEQLKTYSDAFYTSNGGGTKMPGAAPSNVVAKPEAPAQSPVLPSVGTDQTAVSAPAANAPAKALPQGYGTDNKLVTKDRAEELAAKLRAKVSTLTAGVDPELLMLGAELAVYHVEAGARSFVKFSKAMASHLGDAAEKLSPYFKAWYSAARNWPGLDRAGMDPESVVDAIDIKDILDIKEGSHDEARTNDEGAAGQEVPGMGGQPVQGDEGGRGPASQQGPASPDSVGLESKPDGNVPGFATPTPDGKTGVRPPGTNVAGERQPAEGGNAPDGRTGAGGSELVDARPGSVGRGSLFHVADPEQIVGGSPVARFNKNRDAIELYHQLRDEYRDPTAEEQATLAGYTGWGSFGQELFNGSWSRPSPKDGWEARDTWLRDSLGQSEWESAQRSILNAHYTDPPTVLAMWSMIARMGFTGGKVLEPAMGIGNFFGMMPLDLKTRSQLTGIELDELTGSMAKMLYPGANISIKGYETSKTPDNFYDVVIGNWPFDSMRPADRRYNKLNPVLHDYFFLKSLDQVRTGGIVIGITSHGTMDKVDKSSRRAMAQKGELIAAFRLPSGAFKEYAGTAVVTDIIILRKRDQPLGIVSDSWIGSEPFNTPSGTPVLLNKYYHENPRHVLGTVDFGHGTISARPGLIVTRPQNIRARLDEMIEVVPVDAFKPDVRTKQISYIANHTDDREGALTETKDGLFVVSGEHLAPAHQVVAYVVKGKAETANRETQLRDLIAMRKAYAELIKVERAGEEATAARKELKKQYDAFTKNHSGFNDSFGMKYLKRVTDPFYPALAALEIEGPDGKTRPAKILSQSTMRPKPRQDNPSVEDAFVLARNGQVSPTLEQIATLAKTDKDAVRKSLVESGAAYETIDHDITPTDLYLAGNVREKLREAEAAVKDGNAHMVRNVEALKRVIPQDIPYHKIEVQFGATWTPPEVYATYVGHMLNLSKEDTAKVKVEFIAGRWKLRLSSDFNYRAEAEAGFGSKFAKFKSLVSYALGNQVMTIRHPDENKNMVVDETATAEVNERIAKIREEFQTWVWSDPERRIVLEREYNEARNAWAKPEYDGSFLKFEGMALEFGNGPLNMRKHQADAIWRGLVTRKGLYAHQVGTGKTFTIGGLAIESRRYGIARKPLLLAHNANSATVKNEIQAMYPGAALLYIDNLSPDSIDVKLRQIANDDWDLIVMPHSLIDRLSLTRETLQAMAQEELDLLEQEAREAAEEDGVHWDDSMLNDPEELKKLRSPTAKDLVRVRNAIITSIDKASQRSSRETAIPFEELGIDMIIVDEAHEFKKPPFSTKMRMKGLNAQTSSRSIALRFLTSYVRANNGGGNVHTFTGTPITNTLVEVFHQMRYLMEDEMRDVGLNSWDGWFGSFAAEVQDVELNAAAEYEAVVRLASFINVPELRRMFGQYMDVVFSENMPEMVPRKTENGKVLSDKTLTESERIELENGRSENAMDRPYKKVIADNADMSVQQLAEFKTLQGYARTWRGMSGRERKATMAAGGPESPIITEGLAGKASFDVRLLNGEKLAGQEGKVPDEPSSKASRAIKNLLEVYHSNDLACQAVFTNSGLGRTATRSVGSAGNKTSQSYKVFSTVHDMVERLVQAGIPREQIAVVDGSTSKQKRAEISEKMNRAEIRIVFGSTQSLGVGVNMQKNLRAMHHMDAPYMPGDLEQRNGRGHRQGNQWNTVLEYRYLTDRLDGRRWQILAIKSKFIKAFLTANDDIRVIEGDGAAEEENDILDTFANAAGDPRILLLEKARKKVEHLQRRERMHTQAVVEAKSTIKTLTRDIASGKERLAIMDGENGILAKIKTAMLTFTANINGKNYATRKDADEAIAKFIQKNVRIGDNNVAVGTIYGFPVRASFPKLGEEAILKAEIQGANGSHEVQSHKSSLASLEAAIRGVVGSTDRTRGKVSEFESSLLRLDEISKETFGRQTELEAMKELVHDITSDMEANPVPPPAWLRNGAPVDTDVVWGDTTFTVSGHRWASAGWFVMASDERGQVAIPYNEIMDDQGMRIYDDREFDAPEVVVKEKKEPEIPESDAHISVLSQQDRRPADPDEGRTAEDGLSILKYKAKPVKWAQVTKSNNTNMPGSRTLFRGTMNGKTAFSNGHYLLEGKPPAKLEEQLRQPISDIDMEFFPKNYSPTESIKVIGFIENDTQKRIWFDKGSPIDAKYYDLILNLYPDATFKQTNDGGKDNPLAIFSKDSVVGYVMPIKSEVPSGIESLREGPGATFSRGATGPGMSIAAAEKAIARPVQAFPSSISFHVVPNTEGLPPHLKAAAMNGTMNGEQAIKALLDETTGRDIYLVADQFSSAGDLQRAVFHEGYGHIGPRSLLGADIIPVLNQVALAFPARMQEVAKDYKFDLTDKLQRLKAAEEVLARVAERNERPRLIQRAVEAIKTWLVKNGFTAWKYTDADLVAMIARGKRTLGGGGPVSGRRPYGPGNVTEQRGPLSSPQAFYSKLEEVVRNKVGGKILAPALKNMLKNNGVTDDEIATILPGLDAKGVYTKQEVLDEIAANSVEFEDVVLGTPGGGSIALRAVAWRDIPQEERSASYSGYEEMMEDGGFLIFNGQRWVGTDLSGAATPEGAIEAFKREAEQEGYDGVLGSQETQFSQYVEPGAVEGSYREMSVTAPDAFKKSGMTPGVYPTFQRKRATGTPEQEAALAATMATPSADMTWAERAKTILYNFTARVDPLAVRQGMMDDFASIESYEEDTFGQVMDASISPSKAARLTRNLDSVMAAVMLRGALLFRNGSFHLENAKSGKGFADIFAPLTNHADGNLLRLWEGWAAAVRANRLIKEGRENNFTQDQIDALLPLEQQYPLFRQIFDEYQTFNNKILDLAEATGVIDGEARAEWSKNDYVPFYRVVEDIQGAENVKGPFKKRGLANQKSGIMRLKGGAGKINVMENMLLNAAKLIDSSFKNIAAQRIVDMAEGTGAIEEISKTWKPVMVPNSMIRKALEASGILPDNETSWGNVAEIGHLGVGEFMDSELSAWSKLLARWAPQGPDVITVLSGGKPRYFRVHDPLLLRSMTAMGPTTTDGMLTLMKGAKKLLTHSVTVNPAFMMANFLRDTLSTWVVTDTNMIPFLHAGKEFINALGKDEKLMAMMAAGAGGGGYYHVRKEGARDMIADQVKAMESTRFKDTVLHSPRKAWRFYQKIGAATESANRMVVFDKTLKAGGSIGEAAYQAMDTLNFTRSGDYAVMRFMVQTVPFLNARIQGLDRLYRGVKENPRSFALKGLMLTGATLALYAINMGNPDYEDLPEWDKDLYWHFFTPFGHFRMPKPFEVGAIFSTIPERMMELIREKEGDMFVNRMVQMFLDTFAFNPIPQLFKPIVEEVANKSFFSDSPIVSQRLQRLEPEAQYDPWTSESLRLLAEGMPDSAPAFLRSPKRLGHLLYGYTSAVSTYALMASDAILRKTGLAEEIPAGSVQDIPVLNRFVREDSPRSTKYSNEFYEMTVETAKIYSTIKEYRKRGRKEDADTMLRENLAKLRARPQLAAVQKRLQDINNRIRLVWSSRELTREEKQSRVDKLNAERNRLQKLAVERYGAAF
jgi:N12 class adenine-specific DNA methylase/GGDEF domain-containing protein